MARGCEEINSIDYGPLRYKGAVSSPIKRTLIPSVLVNGQPPIFCGKCGTPNPAENQYCRRCGHRLADDIVEIGDHPESVDNSTPISPVEGIDVVRFPLVDPESGEEIEPEVEPRRQHLDEPPIPVRRGSVILWSLGVHFLIISMLSLMTLVVMAQLTPTLSPGNLQDLLTRSEDVRSRFESDQISRDDAQEEERQILESHGILRLFLYLSGPVLLGFFVSGLIAGRLWRPRQLLDVGLAGLMLGGLCSLCLFSPLVWPLAFALSLLGAIVGRRLR